jgi:hypothetical protein
VILPDRQLDTGEGCGYDGREEKGSEIRTGELMDSLEGFQQSRAVIEDFSTRTLAAIHSDFGRLAYISSLIDSRSGRYEHDGLTELYPRSAVQAALKHCHEELFLRVLETPLKDQERDFRKCVDAGGEEAREQVNGWGQDRFFQRMCPQGLPDYLQDLFCANMRALVAILSSGRTN